jgi:hypothetical protein
MVIGDEIGAIISNTRTVFGSTSSGAVQDAGVEMNASADGNLLGRSKSLITLKIDTQKPTDQPADNAIGASDSMPAGPIPSPPPRTEYPATQITDSDIRTYLVPLYSRKWFITYERKKGIARPDILYSTAVLRRSYEFSMFESAMDFVNEVARLSHAEKVSSSF